MSTTTPSPTRVAARSWNRLPGDSAPAVSARTVVITEGLIQNQGVVISSQAILSRVEDQPGSVRPYQPVTKEVKLRAPDSGQYVLQETNHHFTLSLQKCGEKTPTILYEADNTTLTLPATSSRVAETLSSRYGQDFVEGGDAIGIRSPSMIQVIHTGGATTVYDRGTRSGSYHWDPATDKLTGVEHVDTQAVHVEGTWSPDGQAWHFPDHAVDPFIPRLAIRSLTPPQGRCSA